MGKTWVWVADFGRDVRHGLRTLRHAPVFAVVALGTLALAIGANTAIFSLVDLLVLRDLPVRAPASLVEPFWRYPGDPPMNAFTARDYETYRTRNTVFSELIGTASHRVEASIHRTAGETVSGEYVTRDFFPALGTHPALGRLLLPEDDRPGAAPVAVISWSCWREQFDLHPDVVGTQIVVDDLPVTVVGVADQDFLGLVVGYRPDIWMPATAYRGKQPLRFMLLARLREGVSMERARAEMRALDRARIEELARRDPQWRTVALDLRSARAGLSTPLHEQFTKPLLVLMAVVGVLLLLACANIGGLLLARTAERRHEMAVRVALGAGRLRIARQVLAESLLLSAAGGGLGVVAAYSGANTLVRIVTSGTRLIGVPPHLDIAIDGRVLVFTTAATLSAAVLFGLAPVWAAFASAPALALKGGAGRGHASSRRLFGNGFVTVQVSLSLVLLSLSQLYVAHLSQLRDGTLGFDRNSVLLVSVDLAHAGWERERINQLYGDLLGRLQAIPGVRSATVSGMTPISGAAGSQFVTVEGFREAPETRRRLSLNGVGPNYFATFGTPLVAGRDFRATDAGGPRVAIVNEAMARHYFAGGNPIGKHIWFDGEPQPFEIVGLAGDAKYSDVRVPAPPTMYMYHTELFAPPSEFSVRTSVPPAAIAGEVRRVIGEVLSNGPVTRMTTLADQVDASIVPERLIATLAGFFGIVGIVLASVGLFGLMAHGVARRTNEIGVRMALGATPGNVIRLILANALRPVGAGLAIGAPVAIWSRRVAAAVVENLPGTGLSPIVVAGTVIVGAALLASYAPVRRAARVDPLTALRSE